MASILGRALISGPLKLVTVMVSSPCDCVLETVSEVGLVSISSFLLECSSQVSLSG